jgi:NADP-dependent alcohol dehydrogenase
MLALQTHNVTEFGGIEPNPHYETCMEAVNKIKQDKVDFLLAVGGGSVIDATKYIAAAVCCEEDPWKLMTGELPIRDAMPLGTVLTLPATGSEMNKNFVVTKASTKEKLACSSPFVFPKFSVLDPETTYSLPAKQTANGIADAFVHVLEQYLTAHQEAFIQDYFAESIIKVLLEKGVQVFQSPSDYDIRANLMWASTWALNEWIAQGVSEDWATHMIGHELTAFYGIDHGQTLAIVLPGVMHLLRTQKGEKILRLGKNVFGINSGTIDERIDMTIHEIEQFFRSIGIKTKLSEYGLGIDAIDPIVERFKERKWQLGEAGNIDYEMIEKILRSRI